MILTREPIPKYSLLNPVSLLWTWHFKHYFMLTCCKQLHLPVIQLMANIRKFHLKLFNTFSMANNNIKSTFKLNRKLDWCLKLISVMWKWNTGIISNFLKTSTLYVVTPEVTELIKIKYQKKTSCISIQRTIMKHEKPKAAKKFLKITGSNTSGILLFYLIFYAKQRSLKW